MYEVLKCYWTWSE